VTGRPRAAGRRFGLLRRDFGGPAAHEIGVQRIAPEQFGVRAEVGVQAVEDEDAFRPPRGGDAVRDDDERAGAGGERLLGPCFGWAVPR